MIVIAIVILLIIMIVANIGLAYLNKVDPPCNTLDEYFRSAKKISRDSMVGLSSVTANVPIDIETKTPDVYFIDPELDDTSASSRNNIISCEKEECPDSELSEDMNKSSFYTAVSNVLKSKAIDAPESKRSNFDNKREVSFRKNMNESTNEVPNRNTRRRTISTSQAMQVTRNIPEGYHDRNIKDL